MNVDPNKRLRDAAYFAYHVGLCGWYATVRPALSSTRFILFGRGRSGSTALVNLMNQVDGVHCDGEVLAHRVAWPRQHIDACCGRSSAPCYGCKVLSFQLSSLQPIASGADFLGQLETDGYRIIYLKRENVLRHALSNVHARAVRFHEKKGTPRAHRPRMTVDPAEVERWMTGSLALDDYEADVLRGVPHLPLTYERNLQQEKDHQDTVDRICDFIGIPSSPVACEYRKVTPPSIQDFVSNYDELERYLTNSPLEAYVETSNAKF